MPTLTRKLLRMIPLTSMESEGIYSELSLHCQLLAFHTFQFQTQSALWYCIADKAKFVGVSILVVHSTEFRLP